MSEGPSRIDDLPSERRLFINSELSICLPSSRDSRVVMNAATFGTSGSRLIPESGNHVISHRILQEFCVAINSEFFHHSVLVEGDCSRRNSEDIGHPFHGIPFNK